MKIEPWDRAAAWSTGEWTPDLVALGLDCTSAAIHNLCQREQSALTLKLGDLVGCPLAEHLLEKNGSVQTIRYFSFLLNFYRRVADQLWQDHAPWKNEWGAAEQKDISAEPFGEYAEQIPEDIRCRGILRGPGKYHEFSISYFCWLAKIEWSEVARALGRSRSVEEFHCVLLIEFLRPRIGRGLSDEELRMLRLGVCDPGYVRQNNCHSAVQSFTKTLREACLAEFRWDVQAEVLSVEPP